MHRGFACRPTGAERGLPQIHLRPPHGPVRRLPGGLAAASAAAAAAAATAIPATIATIAPRVPSARHGRVRPPPRPPLRLFPPPLPRHAASRAEHKHALPLTGPRVDATLPAAKHAGAREREVRGGGAGERGREGAADEGWGRGFVRESRELRSTPPRLFNGSLTALFDDPI
jgi:hypothetical protein